MEVCIGISFIISARERTYRTTGSTSFTQFYICSIRFSFQLKQNNRFLQTKLTDMDYRKCYLSSEIQQKDRTIEHLKNRLSSVPQVIF